MAKKEVEEPRNEVGQWVTGVSGNPSGRPKGSKNQITLLKESLELQLREQGANFMPQILQTAIELALEGDRTMLKLLLELHMTKGGTGDVKAGQEKVTINISGPERTLKDVIEVEDAGSDDITDGSAAD